MRGEAKADLDVGHEVLREERGELVDGAEDAVVASRVALEEMDEGEDAAVDARSAFRSEVEKKGGCLKSDRTIHREKQVLCDLEESDQVRVDGRSGFFFHLLRCFFFLHFFLRLLLLHLLLRVVAV